ncbi:MAG: response regulator [Candidatus Harrisonbacteria bacterium CG10_big_fil_rev_8_21_14_0_10_42_17]|uniref:Response regulator n=1 Tax=Candidatus Harrisonbacteria bacterium CG10_big_fil_rev_8_21_14_0_10_42_17 TaxID=1974584 RepID=A0A2M6WHG1_9BACT|nr:MAG: response regulator [Candidatus Harrisonbacteria bacterium CG10_big_fil_rev_8_21_14_0_10_42_17]
MEQPTNRIIIAEDEGFLSKELSDKLEKAGFTVATAKNGVEAMKLMNEERPSLLLLDLMMPEKSGFEVLSEMKSNEGLKEIPVIIISNLGQESDVQRGMQLGAVDYIVKARITMKEVVEKVKAHIH